MAASDLAQLADVKAWVPHPGGIGTSDDAILTRLITDLSGNICSYLGRPFLVPQQVTERYDGNGKRRLYLRNYPVVAVASLVVDGVSIPAAVTPGAGVSWPQAGYLLEPWNGMPPGGIQALDCYGDWSFGGVNSFRPGRQNVQVAYTAGYAITGEAATVPAVAPYQIAPLAPYGPWASDLGVTYANGTALTQVSGAPAQGQYGIANGAYAFAAADEGQALLLSYGFVPAAINNACIEWVAERYRYRSRIGQSAENVSGVIAWQFSLKGMPDFIKASLDPYRNVVPL